MTETDERLNELVAAHVKAMADLKYAQQARDNAQREFDFFLANVRRIEREIEAITQGQLPLEERIDA